MGFWHNLQALTGVVPLHWLTLGFFVALVALYLYVPFERARLRAAAVLYVLALFGFTFSALIQRPDMQQSVGYQWLAWTTRFVSAVAIINLARVLLVDVLLVAVRYRPSRILIDLLLAAAYVVVGITLLSRGGV